MTPDYYTTKNRPPTEADGKWILAYNKALKSWETAHWSTVKPEGFSHWQPMLPPPVSPEDAAFVKFCEEHGWVPSEEKKAVWNAALAWERRQPKTI
jgi:hypothetical protein